jgi:MFS family permease
LKAGFYTIMAAQFFSSLADNALLIAAIALLMQSHEPEWMTPLLKLFFIVSYVMLAPLVGAFADSMPKGRVMFITNTIKIVGCAMMFFSIHPLLAYAVVGLGAAAYSPAKYGILTELLPPQQLVVANGWIEGLTVASIILGTLAGGALISPTVSGMLLSIDVPMLDTTIDTAAEAAIAVTISGYAIAAAFNLYIPDTGVDHRIPHRNPVYLFEEFAHCVKLLWKDKLGQISLATTTLFWGAGATLQFIVLKWAETALNLPLSQASMLQGVTAVGIAMGAVAAAKFVALKDAPRVIPLGMFMGLGVIGMVFVRDIYIAIAMLIAIGALAGFFVLMGAGHSIAVQNFNENISVLTMLGIYALMIRYDLPIYTVIVLFGLFVAGAMFMVRKRHLGNAAREDLSRLIGVDEQH